MSRELFGWPVWFWAGMAVAITAAVASAHAQL